MVFFFWTGQEFDFSHLLALDSARRFSIDPVHFVVDEPPVDNEHFRRAASLAGVTVERLDPAQLMPAPLAALYRRLRFRAHKADLVRFCLLLERGGIYLDCDTLTCGSLERLAGNFLIRDDRIVHNSIMALEAGHPLLRAMVHALVHEDERTFDSYPAVVHLWTRVVERERAPAVTFLPEREFFPVRWYDWERLFRPDASEIDTDGITVLHHFGYFSRRYTAEMDLTWLREHPCPYSELARSILDEEPAPLTAAGSARGRG